MNFFFRYRIVQNLKKKMKKNCIIPTNVTYTFCYVNCLIIYCLIIFNIKHVFIICLGYINYSKTYVNKKIYTCNKKIYVNKKIYRN